MVAIDGPPLVDIGRPRRLLVPLAEREEVLDAGAARAGSACEHETDQGALKVGPLIAPWLDAVLGHPFGELARAHARLRFGYGATKATGDAVPESSLWPLPEFPASSSMSSPVSPDRR